MNKMEKFDWKLSIRRNIQVLKLTGLWPELHKTGESNLYVAYSAITLVVFVYGHNFFQTVNIFYVYPNLEAISSTIFVTLSEMLTMVKCYHMLQNREILQELMATINQDSFQPKNRAQKYIIETSLNFWKKIGIVLWSMSAGAVFFWAVYPIVDNTSEQRRLPFLAWYPYDTTISPNYEITYVYQIVSTSIIASATLSIDMLIAALNVCIGAQCDILCDDLRYIRGDINKQLIYCIKHHQEILTFAANSNKFSNWIVFAQFFVSAASIGIIMFQLTIVVPFTSEFYSILTFGIAVIVEIFMYCWFGNEVAEKSGKIAYSVFESDWTRASIQARKVIIFFAMKNIKPIKMSALNLFYLSLETFMKILRTSWSYFALLHQVNS